jgi:hypothetical protein
MTARRAAMSIPRLLTAVVLVVSGGYLLVYLYRWEWNRAIVSGIFFVAAEVALGFSVLLRRLRSIEQRLDPEPVPARSLASERLAATPVDRPDPFAWLDPGAGRMGVFVPVLLGAGVILSAVAYLVERVAQVTAGPGVDRRLAQQLDLLAPPDGGLTGAGPPTPPEVTRRRRSPIALGLGLVSLTLLVVLAVDVLADATQSRPESEPPPPAVTTIGLTIAHRPGAPAPAVAAEALWTTCRSVLGEDQPDTVALVPRGGDRLDVVLRPGIGELAERRLDGCLTDLQLDLVQADVVPAAQPPGR